MGFWRRYRWWFVGVGSVLLITMLTIGILLYSWIYRPAINGLEDDGGFLFIPTGSGYSELLTELDSVPWLKSVKAFNWVAQRKSLPVNIHPGRYSVFN
ncbi:MAG: hypothetical protein J7L96_01880, partial [Bacteroidales bacterium]|nr:hypothetical protein [Bacteroidales bacterium]